MSTPNRKSFDCPFCGTPVDPAVWRAGGPYGTEDRCPECLCVLSMNHSETDWTNEWRETF